MNGGDDGSWFHLTTMECTTTFRVHLCSDCTSLLDCVELCLVQNKSFIHSMERISTLTMNWNGDGGDDGCVSEQCCIDELIDHTTIFFFCISVFVCDCRRWYEILSLPCIKEASVSRQSRTHKLKLQWAHSNETKLSQKKKKKIWISIYRSTFVYFGFIFFFFFFIRSPLLMFSYPETVMWFLHCSFSLHSICWLVLLLLNAPSDYTNMLTYTLGPHTQPHSHTHTNTNTNTHTLSHHVCT